jgi:hypothetical protein
MIVSPLFSQFSVDSYLDNLRNYLREDYELKDEDILKLRMKSSGLCLSREFAAFAPHDLGLVETRFEIDDLKVLLVDVGGQRSERRKWFHCFLDVTAVLYFISLSECMLFQTCPFSSLLFIIYFLFIYLFIFNFYFFRTSLFMCSFAR